MHDEKRDSEQIRSAFSHSDDLRRLATFSTLQKNLLFTRSSKQGFGLSDPHLPPQAAGLLKSALREPVLPLPRCQWDPRADQVALATSRGARTLPRRETGAQPAFGKLIIRGRALPTLVRRMKFCAHEFVPPSPADGFGGCFDPWPSLSNKYHRSRGNTIIRSRQAGPFVGEFVADD